MSKKILIVDDEPRYLRLLEANLRTEGYEVVTAQDGLQALEAFSAQPIDLVLMDVMMPRMDGISLSQHIRSDPKTSHIPVILVTAGQLVECPITATAILHKPFHLERLVSLVRQHVV